MRVFVRVRDVRTRAHEVCVRRDGDHTRAMFWHVCNTHTLTHIRVRTTRPNAAGAIQSYHHIALPPHQIKWISNSLTHTANGINNRCVKREFLSVSSKHVSKKEIFLLPASNCAIRTNYDTHTHTRAWNGMESRLIHHTAANGERQSPNKFNQLRESHTHTHLYEIVGHNFVGWMVLSNSACVKVVSRHGVRCGYGFGLETSLCVSARMRSANCKRANVVSPFARVTAPKHQRARIC